ncbi:hypothetical protein [Streptomyces sp. NPDC005438]|uniref:hypothetical protein n=1 Tax=Streptomyces sp. NPDC005438 TaxID=3156880 RepID=UPI0033B173C6
MHPRKTTTSIALASCIALLSACGTSETPKKEEPSSEPPLEMTRIQREICEFIFSKESIAELRKNTMTKKVFEGGPGLLLFHTVGNRMAKGMKTYGNMGTCGLYDSKRREVIGTPTDWGPRTFPAKSRQQGKNVIYEDAGRKGPHRVHRILVDCDKKKTPQDGKKKLPIQVDLEQRAHLTNRTLADILNHAAQNLVHQIKCKNAPQITYEKPEFVKFTPAP